MSIAEGDRIPSVTLKQFGDGGFTEVSTDDLFKGRKVVLFGVPGAYTPSCSDQHLPGYIAHAEAFKAKGVDAIVCMAVNDPFVMKQWGADKGATDKVVMLPDGNATLTKALGLDFDGSGFSLGTRCHRFAALVEDGVVKKLAVEEAPPAVTVSSAESMLQAL